MTSHTKTATHALVGDERKVLMPNHTATAFWTQSPPKSVLLRLAVHCASVLSKNQPGFQLLMK